MKLYYGAAYYPEQWPEKRWPIDINLMADAGLNAVRLGEFAWGRMEKAPGEYDWSWLDQVTDMLHGREMKFVLCTPTAGPPIWVVESCPGMLLVNYNRKVRPVGGRRHYCYNNPEYRKHSVRIAAAMAQRYGRHEGLLGWEIDNEFAQEFTGRCCCTVCEGEFRLWLERRYGSIAELNRAWGTVFWSQEYSRWDQIEAPYEGVAPEDPQQISRLRLNPAWLLDYERFCSDSIVDYQNLQVEAIRAHSTTPISHNGTGISVNYVDYYDLHKTLDRGGLDCYPSVVTEDYAASSRNLSQARCLTAGPSWILELSSGGGPDTWGKSGKPQAPPGSLRLVAWQSFINGAELALYFQWRIFPRGTEQLESAILDLDGVPRRKYEELAATAQELKRLDPWITETEIVAPVALVWCYDHHWAHAIKPYRWGTSYNKQHEALYAELATMRVGVDVVSIDADFSRYRVVVLPSPILMRPDLADRLKEYVQNGGTVVTTFLTAVKDWTNAGITDKPLPGYLDDLFGVRLYEVDPGAENLPTQLALKVGESESELGHGVWSDILEPQTAEVLGRLTGSWRSGEPVVTRHHYGDGFAYYLGTWPSQEGLRILLEAVLSDAGVQRPALDVPPGVEVVTRRGARGEVTFLLNWTFQPVRVGLGQKYCELFGQQAHEGEFQLGPRDVAALLPAI